MQDYLAGIADYIKPILSAGETKFACLSAGTRGLSKMSKEIKKVQMGFQYIQLSVDKLSEELKKKFPSQNVIKIKNGHELVKMASGLFTLDGITPLEKVDDSEIKIIRNFLLFAEDEANDLSPGTPEWEIKQAKKKEDDDINSMIPDDEETRDDSEDENSLIPD